MSETKERKVASAAHEALEATKERPAPQRPSVDLWSENYLFQANDFATGLGFWTHVGRPVYDTSIWQDLTIVYLPGGEEVLLAKGHGWQSGPADVPSSAVHATYDEATASWNVRFRGGAQRATRTELASGPLTDRRAEPFACELEFSTLGPIWDMTPDVDGQAWSNAHWEQHCLVSGWAEWGGTRREFRGAGVRDHSRGGRNFLGMGPYRFLQGQFPGGRAFGLLQVDPLPDRPAAMTSARAVLGGQLVEATIVATPASPEYTQPFEVQLRTSEELHTISGTITNEAVMTMDYPNEVIFGHRSGALHHHIREAQVRWTWDGETGWGIAERGVPHDDRCRPIED